MRADNIEAIKGRSLFDSFQITNWSNTIWFWFVSMLRMIMLFLISSSINQWQFLDSNWKIVATPNIPISCVIQHLMVIYLINVSGRNFPEYPSIREWLLYGPVWCKTIENSHFSRNYSQILISYSLIIILISSSLFCVVK